MIRKRTLHADRRLGPMWPRVCGTVFLAIGVLSAVSVAESEGFALATHWPELKISTLFILAAIGCFRSRRSLVDTVSENHPDGRG